MQQSIFVVAEFYALVAFSVVFPVAILVGLLIKKAIARTTVLMFGVLLILLSGVDFVLLHHLQVLARHTSSLLDDELFGSALAIALYLLPVVFAGIGTNVVSHVLIQHLAEAEEKYDQKYPES